LGLLRVDVNHVDIMSFIDLGYEEVAVGEEFSLVDG
jgi:hypothetical protein